MQTIPPPGPHGDDALRVAAALAIPVENLLDLSVTTNPLAPHPAVIISEHLESLSQYPDLSYPTDVLADTIGVASDTLLLTNGGAEAIALVADELKVGVVQQPDFSLYERHLLGQGPERWASNPNNPTGLLADKVDRARVWDEAFYGLATGSWTRGDGEIVVGSLTKLLRCPGLRVGYVLSPDIEFVARLRQRQPLWSVNSLACAAMPDLLASVDLESWSTKLRSLRSQLVDLLASHGLRALPSDANFVLVPHAFGVRDALARERVLVRDCASFELVDHVRIAVPDEAGLGLLALALDRAQEKGDLCDLPR
jgi:histidinol-phosphate/aromatic aminotransferase/cobyric acid decarboxylase-like protein